MLLEDVYPAAKLQRSIDEAQHLIKEINELPVRTLRMSPIHGRSLDIPIDSEQTAFAIKQMLVLGLEAKVQQASMELQQLL